MSNTPNINKTFIIESPSETPIISGCTGIFLSEMYACEDNNVNINTNLTLIGDIEPLVDNTQVLGSTLKRFREINTYSGKSTIWEATDKLITNEIDLGLDSNNINRKITSNNSIIQDDTLKGGSY